MLLLAVILLTLKITQQNAKNYFTKSFATLGIFFAKWISKDNSNAALYMNFYKTLKFFSNILNKKALYLVTNHCQDCYVQFTGTCKCEYSYDQTSP